MDIPFLSDLKSIIDGVTESAKHAQFGTKAQLHFLEDFYLLINDGIPANRAVEMMVHVTTGITREVALNISGKISEGLPLADGMAEWFSPNVVEIIRVGESGGALVQTVKSAINALSQRGVAYGAFITALAYPLVVLIMACGVIVYLNTSVFVQFRAIKPESEWPEAGQRLVWLANFIEGYWWLAVIAVVAIAVYLARQMANYTGSFRNTLDDYPPFSFYRKFMAARVLETLGLLVANGVVFKSALRVMQYQANPYLNMHLQKMEELLGTGKSNIADVLATGLVSDSDLMRLRVMAEVKGFEHGLVRMGVRGAEEATAMLKFIARVIGGIFLVCGGIMILMIMQGIYTTGMGMAAT